MDSTSFSIQFMKIFIENFIDIYLRICEESNHLIVTISYIIKCFIVWHQSLLQKKCSETICKYMYKYTHTYIHIHEYM